MTKKVTVEKIAHSTPVVLDDGTEVLVGRLSTRQVLRLIKVSAKYLGAVTEEQQAALGAVAKGGSLFDTISVLTDIVSDGFLDEVCAVVADVSEERTRDVSLPVLADIVAAVTEHNEPQRIAAAFGRAAEHWKSAAN